MATVHVKIPDPFGQTALLHDEDENIIHVGGFRTRVTGSGNLDATLYDMDSVRSQTLNPIVMAATTEDEPFKLANFNSQRVMLRLGTNVINEYFHVTKIVAFFKTLWTEFPR